MPLVMQQQISKQGSAPPRACTLAGEIGSVSRVVAREASVSTSVSTSLDTNVYGRSRPRTIYLSTEMDTVARYVEVDGDLRLPSRKSIDIQISLYLGSGSDQCSVGIWRRIGDGGMEREVCLWMWSWAASLLG